MSDAPLSQQTAPLSPAQSDRPSHSEWPLRLMLEVNALREGKTDQEFIAELEGLKYWFDHIIKGLRP